MIVLHVSHIIKPESVEVYIDAMLESRRQTLLEPGCLGFDFLQHIDDPHRFLLVERYVDEESIDTHRATPHFKAFRRLAETAEWYLNKSGGLYRNLGEGDKRASRSTRSARP